MGQEAVLILALLVLYWVLHIVEEVGEDAGMRDLVVFCGDTGGGEERQGELRGWDRGEVMDLVDHVQLVIVVRVYVIICS